jgi:hypothetical protein
MLDTTHLEPDLPIDPAPRYATAEEIALADRLRKRIEERYLGTANANGRNSEELRPLKKAA